ncbi:hypothetical protein ThidrDRAFT_2804 [Thiorhodococcus drewsii AZ1]|uniref:Flagellar basal-body/hook protein C-terminal domain-containing protein n=1 Tax=Thiorhodococcus drewsii AZ1 TaxID=765913 RepID=G2E3E1_9GAMM|nr:hypothetical protein [Thiorhodococcus drewsii]EGV30330.1 hypothetical protein ThidrDRAFT_2804 [Thiorhodococcus drewsii AZ1]
MMISSALQSGLAGMSAGMNGMSRGAAEIASSQQMNGTASRDVAEPLVEQTQSVRQVEASAKVVAASDEVLGTLIDVMA